MTLREYVAVWQETYDRPKNRPSTCAAHRYIFQNHILPGLGDAELSELTEAQVGAFLADRQRNGNHRADGGLGAETMRHIHRLLQQCLEQAVRAVPMPSNPARVFQYQKERAAKATVLTPLETENYLDAAGRLGCLPLFLLALTAGLREGELIALRWDDLDVNHRTLTVAGQRRAERGTLVSYGDRTRTIPLAPETVDLLCAEHRKHPNSPLMFMHPATQKPYAPQTLRRMHEAVLREAGLSHIRFADLRHTCAVLALGEGAEVRALSRMLGHCRTTLTRQAYKSYLPQTGRPAAENAENTAQNDLRQASEVLDGLLDF